MSDRTRAAVSLIVRADERLDLLIIKRARSQRDPWSGHMALPGGRGDSADATIVDTAVRETLEEVGIDLAAVGSRLGRLDDVVPGSTRLPLLSISPFVFGVPANTRACVASPEVDAVHWVALGDLRSPGTHDSVDVPLPTGVRSFPCFRVAGEAVWGLTYRILTRFLDAYSDAELRAASARD